LKFAELLYAFSKPAFPGDKYKLTVFCDEAPEAPLFEKELKIDHFPLYHLACGYSFFMHSGQMPCEIDFEVVGASEANDGIRSGSMDTIAWQDNDRFLQLFEPARLQAGQTVSFKSSCLLLKTPEYGWVCGTIRKDLP